MTSTSDTSGIYRPTADAPKYPATASYAVALRPHAATTAAEALRRVRAKSLARSVGDKSSHPLVAAMPATATSKDSQHERS